jgi:hypothetical protein
MAEAAIDPPWSHLQSLTKSNITVSEFCERCSSTGWSETVEQKNKLFLPQLNQRQWEICYDVEGFCARKRL